MDFSDDVLRLTRRLRLKAEEQVQPLHWCPPADVYRTAEGWLIKFELAGVRSEEIEVRLHGPFVSVSGRRRDTVVLQESECYAMEITYSRFERAIRLPCDLKGVRAITRYRDGMLLLRLVTEDSGP